MLSCKLSDLINFSICFPTLIVLGQEWAGRALRPNMTRRMTCPAPHKIVGIGKTHLRSYSSDGDYINYAVEQNLDEDYDHGGIPIGYDDLEAEYPKGRFWGGLTVNTKLYVSYTAIFERQENGQELHVCSGGFIHPQVVLTAASCFRYFTNDGKVDAHKYFIKYFANEYEVTAYDQRLDAREILIRREFNCRDEPSPTKSAHNIALMYLVTGKVRVDTKKPFVYLRDIIRLPKFDEKDLFWSDSRPQKLQIVSAGQSFSSEIQGGLKRKFIWVFRDLCAVKGGWPDLLKDFHVCPAVGALLLCLGLLPALSIFTN